MRVIAASVFCLTLIQIATVLGAEDSRSSHLQVFKGEDKSCYAVNRAYENTHNSGRYSFTVSELQEDGHLRPYMEARAIDGVFYSRIENGVWDEDKRLPIRTLSMQIRGCQSLRLVKSSGTRKPKKAWLFTIPHTGTVTNGVRQSTSGYRRLQGNSSRQSAAMIRARERCHFQWLSK
ncbi:hypothetical protein J3P71_17825 [Rhizobium leguminosarum]|uniref:hypothetical protein n=1 Tax=Rhizobium leguminosarum TaxID=384 RepID=UPI0014412D97|nr:hypothetical protein [Rhizobium leguminosarum]MBY5838091.1 hypothetical protein [Rhizobium leguminosarum]NKM82617.1 hypothetical protein [Rhizobium leguminosarum bv. viciae]QSZ06727.1 hypothetical protein J3P71_17825 [Rhizobium leguminosarum]